MPSVPERRALQNLCIAGRRGAWRATGSRDRYGRLLAYVFLADGTSVNKLMITGGYGHEYTYKLPYKWPYPI